MVLQRRKARFQTRQGPGGKAPLGQGKEEGRVITEYRICRTKEEAALRVAWLEGKIDAIRDYAIYKNGEQLVGCLQTPLHEVLKPYQREIQIQIERHDLHTEPPMTAVEHNRFPNGRYSDLNQNPKKP